MTIRISKAELPGRIRERAEALGFSSIRFTKADLPPVVQDRYRQAIGLGRHGSMAWLAAEPDRRSSPVHLWPEARSAITLAMNYGPSADPRPELEAKGRAYISVYARHRDYHEVIKGRLKELGQWLHRVGGGEIKVFVDTAPLLEKPLAQQAGLGWQGKHTNLVSRQFGSWLFLGEILTSIDLPSDPPEADHCGQCRRCLDVCPTAAFPAPYQLDARRCISYLTIEHKGPIDREFRHLLGNRIYGCDDCLAACPWNKFASAASEVKLAALPDRVTPSLEELSHLDDASFRVRFSGSPIKRIGRDRFMRNVVLAMGNSGDARFVQPLTRRLGDASPLVRGAAVWALAQLVSQAELESFASAHAGESDPSVREEWRQASRDKAFA
ncbi:epoxyqueuosine reductase [Arboricoccus pini]|uniref:Epoxyqueuosine reductase n=1 Tax=Arboricoccus pini TaxID=1963835 RepID=A0A212R249_9PROT|nr:tRNA epoxyqueuosine(34) reductase QueG [Arboricoccus pini]SNB66083.1 epoxyqueuosine reductase [Arboricoccus pini]